MVLLIRDFFSEGCFGPLFTQLRCGRRPTVRRRITYYTYLRRPRRILGQSNLNYLDGLDRLIDKQLKSKSDTRTSTINNTGILAQLLATIHYYQPQSGMVRQWVQLGL